MENSIDNVQQETVINLGNRATRRIEISGIRRFMERVSQYPDALSLTIGQPHFPTPEHVRLAGAQAIAEGRTTYTPNRGLPELRAAASTYYQRLTGVAYHPDTEILVTVGATNALDIAFRSLLQPGDEVLIPAPVYPGYAPIAQLLDANVQYIDTRKTHFKLTPEALKAAIGPHSKVLVLASPANPTGATYSQAELEALAQVLVETNLFVVSDEIYSELQFDASPVSIAKMAGMRERTVVIQGLSKSHSMTGWRIGFAFAPEQVTNEMVKVLQYSVTCASSISQFAALEALTNGQNDALPMAEQYRSNRNLVVEACREIGIELNEPGGAFYAFPYIGDLGQTSQLFANQLLEQQRLALVPGDAFSPLGEGYVRLSYACEPETLQEGLQRLKAYVTTVRG